MSTPTLAQPIAIASQKFTIRKASAAEFVVFAPLAVRAYRRAG